MEHVFSSAHLVNALATSVNGFWDKASRIPVGVHAVRNNCNTQLLCSVSRRHMNRQWATSLTFPWVQFYSHCIPHLCFPTVKKRDPFSVLSVMWDMCPCAIQANIQLFLQNFRVFCFEGIWKMMDMFEICLKGGFDYAVSYLVEQEAGAEKCIPLFVFYYDKKGASNKSKHSVKVVKDTNIAISL